MRMVIEKQLRNQNKKQTKTKKRRNTKEVTQKENKIKQCFKIRKILLLFPKVS